MLNRVSEKGEKEEVVITCYMPPKENKIFYIYFSIFYVFLRATAELQRCTWDSVAYKALCHCNIGIKVFFERYRANEIVHKTQKLRDETE